MDRGVPVRGGASGPGATRDPAAIGERTDLTFYLRISSEERARRARESGAPLDRIEKVGDDFMRRVEEGFEKIVRSEPERVRALDATLPPEELSKTVAQEILGVGGAGGSF